MEQVADAGPQRDDGPGRAVLWRLYVDEQRSLADLQARYGVGTPTARRWLVEAGIEIRQAGAGGYRRLLTPPPAAELVELGRTLPTSAIAQKLRVSNGTVLRWFAEAGLTPPAPTLKNRPRGSLTAVERPAAKTLEQLYTVEGLSIAGVAEKLAVTVHLVRTWLQEHGIGLRPAGGRAGRPRQGKIRKPAPPTAELERLRAQRLSRGELAARYGVHPQTVSKWLADAGLPGTLPPPGPTDLAARAAAMYRSEQVSAAEIARRLGVPDRQVIAALRSQGIDNDPSRRIVAVQAAGARRRGTVPSLPTLQGDQAVRLYQDKSWTYQMVAEKLGVRASQVRAELLRRGIPAHGHRKVGPGSRASRTPTPAERVRALYVDSELSANDVAAQLNSAAHLVLRAGHDHGVPIRPGGGGRVAAAAAVAVIDGLYADAQVSQVLNRHNVPRRPPGGSIAERFPDPVPLTAELLTDLYCDAGCSSNQIELLTGQAQVVVRDTMHRLGISLRSEHHSPALHRLRAAARQDFLAQIVDEYRACGSTAKVAELHGCAPDTVRRWLAQAGVAVPGRGQWPRARRPRPADTEGSFGG